MGEIKKLADIVVEARAKGRKKMAVAYGQDSQNVMFCPIRFTTQNL